MRKVLLDKLCSYSLFFNISHCSICPICLGMICWLDLCIIELIWNMLIMFWFVRFTFHFLFLISFGCGWEECNFLFWSFHVISSSLASISNLITGFFRFFGSKRSLWGSTSYQVYFVFPFVSYISIFIICVMCWYYLLICVIFCAHLCFVFNFCDFFDFGWEQLDFLLVAFCHGMLFSLSRLFI